MTRSERIMLLREALINELKIVLTILAKFIERIIGKFKPLYTLWRLGLIEEDL